MDENKIKEYEERILFLEKKIFELEMAKKQFEKDMYKVKNFLDKISPNSGFVERYL